MTVTSLLRLMCSKSLKLNLKVVSLGKSCARAGLAAHQRLSALELSQCNKEDGLVLNIKRDL